MEHLIGSLRALDENCSADPIQRSSATFRRLKGIPRSDMVKTWLREMNATPGKELAFLYVANDIIQKSMAREGNEFANEFGNVLVRAFSIAVSRNKKIIGKIERLVKIWDDRSIYVKHTLTSFRNCLKNEGTITSSQKKRKSTSSSTAVKKKAKVITPKRSKQEKKRGYFGDVVPKVRDDNFESLLQQLSQAKNGVREGFESFSGVDDIVRNGGIPVDFVDQLMNVEKSEFDQFSSEVEAARNAVQRICANIARSQDTRVLIEKKLVKLRDEQQGKIQGIRSDIRGCNAMILSIENLMKQHGKTKIRLNIQTSENLKKQDLDVAQADLNKIHEDVDTAALESAGTSKEELDALAALDSVENLFDTSQDDAAARAKSGYDFDDDEDIDLKKKEQKKKKKKKEKLVWDPRIRGYVRARTGDDEDLWRN